MIALKSPANPEQSSDVKATRSTFTLPEHLSRYIQETSESLSMSPSKFLTTILEWASNEKIVEDILLENVSVNSDGVVRNKVLDS